MKLNKKGFTISDLAPIAVAFVIITVVVGMGVIILAEMNDTTTVNASTDAQSVMNKGIASMGTFADWFDILVIVVIAAVIIGIILFYFGRKEGGGY